MLETIFHYKKIIIAALVLGGLALVAWVIIYSVFIFHITATSPSLGAVSDISPYIKVTFNKPLDASSVRLSSDAVSVSSSVSGNVLTINFLNNMVAGQAYTVSIDSIASTSKDVMTGYKLQFTPSNDPSLITPDQGAAILNQQENNKSPVLSDPIFQYVPYSTLDYSLNGVINSDNSITITIKIQLSAADVSSGQDAAVAQYKQEAMNYLNSLKGINLSNYKIETTVTSPS